MVRHGFRRSCQNKRPDATRRRGQCRIGFQPVRVVSTNDWFFTAGERRRFAMDPANMSRFMPVERSCAKFIFVEIFLHEKKSCGCCSNFGVLRRTTGSCRGRLWNSVAIPVPCLDSFRPLRPRIPRQLRPSGSGPYHSSPQVGWYRYSSGSYPTPAYHDRLACIAHPPRRMRFSGFAPSLYAFCKI
jgi:hypothetical protein